MCYNSEDGRIKNIMIIMISDICLENVSQCDHVYLMLMNG